MNKEHITIHTNVIPLDSLLKWIGIVNTGGEAKALIQSGQVFVNGFVELRRGRKLQPGDKIVVDNKSWILRREIELCT